MVTKSNTKAELLAHVAVLEAELITAGRTAEALRAELSVAKHVAATAPKTAIKVARPAWVRPEWMEQARALAMSSGTVVRLGA